MNPTTIISEPLRKKHFENKALGCGNFLHVAASVSPYADQRHLWTDTPVRLFTGEVFEGFSLNELRHAVDTYASWYYGAGVRAKDPIGIYVSEGIGNLIHYLALNAIGAIPAIVNGNMPAATAALWLEKVGVVGLFTDEAHSPLITPHIQKNSALRFSVTEVSAAKVFKPELPSHYPFQHTDHDTVLIGHSSGTTGIPKAVEFQHQQFFYGIRYRLSLPFPGGSERILSALPHSHSAGIAYLTLALLSGSSTVVLTSNQPEVVLPHIESFKPSMVVAFPETYVLLSDSDLEKYDLSTIQLWFNGGDAAHEAHIRRLIAEGHHVVEGNRRKGSVFIDGLGSSEMGFSLFRNVHTPTTEHYNRCIGKPLDWVDATVLGDNGEKLAPYRVGKLGVKSPTITPGYWNDSVLTKRSQVGQYFLTGDLFYYDEEGRFYHVDRIPDVVKTKGGVVYSLQTEEMLLRKFENISDLSVIAAPAENGFSSAVAVVRLKKGEQAESLALLVQFNDILATAGKRPLDAVVFGDIEDFPLGPTGKVLKRELREQFTKLFKQTAATPEPLHA